MFSQSTGIRRAATFLAAAAALTFGQAANAGITVGDTFTFDIAGFNTASGTGYILGSSLSAVFGTTQTFAAAGYNGQAYTITSSEVVGATTTTDTFKITTPTNFLTSTTVNGVTITALQFDIGDANSGVSFGGVADPLNLSSVVASTTSAGKIVYGTANTNFTLTPTTTLAADGLSYYTVEGVNAGTTAISTLAIHEFDLSVTYANPISAVPETSNWALLLAGLGGMGLVARRSRKA